MSGVGPSVVLRPWTAADAPALAAALLADPTLSRQLPVGDPSAVDPESVVRDVLARATDDRLDLVVSVDGVASGGVSVSHIDQVHETAWVSYWLAPDARGRGYAARAVATVGAHVLRSVFRLELGHRVNNPASCRVATAAGFLVEGVERSKLRYGAERFDVETHARLRTDPDPPLELLTILER